MTNPICVYLVNGSDEVSRDLEKLLGPAGFEVIERPDPGWDARRSGGENSGVILLNWPSSPTEGLGLLHQIAERYPSWPIIAVADGEQVEAVAQAVAHGASDFVTRPLIANVLAARICKAVEESGLRRLAMTDGLTQLYNLRAFTLRLQEEIARANRYDRDLALIMLDIDRFKDYNDSRGHQQGNEVLQQMAHLLREYTRSSDTIARYGGDEFVLILPETEAEAALLVANRLRSVVEGHLFGDKGTQPGGHLTISLGVGCHRAGESGDVLVQRVDEALYRAKGAGRNQVASTP